MASKVERVCSLGKMNYVVSEGYADPTSSDLSRRYLLFRTPFLGVSLSKGGRSISLPQSLLPLLLLLGVVLGGCSSQSNPPSPSHQLSESQPSNVWTPVAEASLSANQQQQKNLALAARDRLFERLMARLAAVMQASGPEGAVAVCREEAPQISRAVSEEMGVTIGRTSHKLRNPNNRPRPWVASVIATKPDTPQFLTAADGRLGAVLPIRLKSQCLTCHGSPEAIPEPVRNALREFYPNDEATGFAENDLRGWFWVEVPPSQAD